MTTSHLASLQPAQALLQSLVPLVNDLARDIADEERYRRLLFAMRELLPCDAVALLKLQGQWLQPVAVNGLSLDTLGRKFKVDEHPRFAAILAAPGPVRFASNSALPDPYDGLVEGQQVHLQVHDCMGCQVLVGCQPWGVLTIDAIDPHSFSRVDLNDLLAFAGLAAATVSVTTRIDSLASSVKHERQRADSWHAMAKNAHTPALMGASAAYVLMMQNIASVAKSDLAVLITGETGVGKELVAMALHAGSTRAAKPMVSINCAALPDALVESELFGHVRGAFSGALSERQGKFEVANGGTLFLDEVGELPLPVQAKLLRVLQNGHVQRVGSDKEHYVDIRVIAATNRDLAAQVQAGLYRADFYHRLSVYPLAVPPLRQRGLDVILLAGSFLEENRARLQLRGLRLNTGAKAAMLAHFWPGNVRELEHLISRSALKATTAFRLNSKTATPPSHAGQAQLTKPQSTAPIVTIGPEHLDLPRPHKLAMPPSALPAVLPHALPAALVGLADCDGVCVESASKVTLRDSVNAHQRRQILAAVARNTNNWTAAAQDLGIERANLLRLARRLDIR